MIPLRDENPRHGTPVVTIFLILVNVVVFFFESTLPEHAFEAFVFDYGVLPVEITTGMNQANSPSISPYSSLITSMFLHGSWGHLIGNMWFLWIFGDNIEDFFGSFKFLMFYIATGIAACLAHIVVNADSSVPLVGASGAISGVLGAYILLHPKIRVNTLIILGFFIRVLPIPAVYFLGIWFVMQLLGGFQPTGQVAYGAHVGGFVAGLLLIFLMTRSTHHSRHARYEPGRVPR